MSEGERLTLWDSGSVKTRLKGRCLVLFVAHYAAFFKLSGPLFSFDKRTRDHPR